MVSNSLDESIIRDIIAQGACVDSFGVGERLITAKSDPVFGGVYKLVAKEEKGGIVPKIKISENTGKIPNPHYKKVYRIFSKESGQAVADLMCVHDEVIDTDAPIDLFDPVDTWKHKTVTDYVLKELQTQVFKNGRCVYTKPSLSEIRDYCKEQINLLWAEVRRFENPHRYYVDLSQKLWDIKHKLLQEKGCSSQ